jgi:hypothetical protein
MPKVLISYRRSDTEVIAGRIRDRLANRYGDDAVFMDIDNIPFGKDFRVHISEAIVQSDILLVIVGQRWLGASRGGTRRIDDETDFVRLELETALTNAIPIVPVLTGSARMPQPAQLPVTLKNLTYLNAAQVDFGRDFEQHMERLIRSIDMILERKGWRPPVASAGKEALPAAEAKRRRPIMAGPEFLASVKNLARDFFRSAGRPIEDGAHDQLLGPDPIWISSVTDPEPQHIAAFSDFLAPGQGGFVVYDGVLPAPTSVFLDRLRVEGKSIIPINVNAISAALADGNAAVFLADLERSYESKDNLFDTRNALVDERFFFGRGQLLTQVGQALARGEHVLITGLRKCGKTSFLNILRQHLSSHPVCFVDLQRYDRHTEDWPKELFKLIVRSYDSWGQRVFNGWPSKSNAEPGTATELESLLGERRRRQLAHGRTERMVVILDEAERIFPADGEVAEARKYTRAAGALRMLSQSSSDRPLSIIGADLRPWLNRRNVLPDGSTNPLFNFFQEIPLPLLSHNAVGELVRVIGSASGVKRVHISYVDELFSMSGGHPSIARMIAGASYKMRQNSAELAPPDLREGLGEMANVDALGFFFRNNLWALMTKEEKEALLRAANRSTAQKITVGPRGSFGNAEREHDPEAVANLNGQGILCDGKITIGALSEWIRQRAHAEA